MSTNIPYYVKDNFHSEYQGSLGRLEATVEDEFKQNLRYACNRERNYSKLLLFQLKCLKLFIFCNYIFAEESMLMKARSFGGKDMYRKAQSIEMPSCVRFENFKRDGHF